MVVRPGELETLARPRTQRRVVARVEELRRAGGATEPVEHLELDLALRARLDPRMDLVDPQRPSRRGDPCIRCHTIAHRGCGIAVDVPEVALAVDERVTHRERLRETYEGVVDRRVAVWVVILHHVADDARALHALAVRLQAR